MIKLRKFKKEDTKAVALLVINTYGKFNSQEYINKSAVKDYLNRYDPKKNTPHQLYENFSRSQFFYVALNNNKIIGMIRGRMGKVSNLFVDGSQHRQGIGKQLMNRFELEMKKQKCPEIRIKASLYATPFYQKMGYKKTTGTRNFRGLKVNPMKKILS